MPWTQQQHQEAAEQEATSKTLRALERLVMSDQEPPPVQTRLGHERTVCQCRDCSRFCEHMPGMLIPEDIDAIAPPDMPDREAFLAEHFLASPGALVSRTGEDGRPDFYRIPTIRPATGPGGACVFLDAHGDCTIHDRSPYGCAVFDDHQTRPATDRKVSDGLNEIVGDIRAGGPYIKLWTRLHELGRVAEPPEEARRRTG